MSGNPEKSSPDGTTEGTMQKSNLKPYNLGTLFREHMCLLSPLTINQILVALALLNKVPAVLKDGKITANKTLITVIDHNHQ